MGDLIQGVQLETIEASRVLPERGTAEVLALIEAVAWQRRPPATMNKPDAHVVTAGGGVTIGSHDTNYIQFRTSGDWVSSARWADKLRKPT